MSDCVGGLKAGLEVLNPILRFTGMILAALCVLTTAGCDLLGPSTSLDDLIAETEP